MRQLFVTTFVSLDGVMQAPGGPEEDPSGGFTLGGWTVPHFDQVLGEVMGRTMGRPFDLVLGRRTYDIFAAHWPHASEEDGAGPLNRAHKYVASRGTPDLDWEGSSLIDGDVVAGISALKAQDGPELQVHGSGNLIQTLLRHRLVDRLQLLIFPVLLGSGRRLFGEGTASAGLRLVDSTVSGSGVIVAVYEPVGDVAVGSFAQQT